MGSTEPSGHGLGKIQLPQGWQNGSACKGAHHHARPPELGLWHMMKEKNQLLQVHL